MQQTQTANPPGAETESANGSNGVEAGIVAARARVGAPVEVESEGMLCVDTSSSQRIPVLMEMVAALSRATEPNDVITTFGKGIRRLNGPRGYMSLSTRGLKAGEYRITRTALDGSADGIQNVNPWATIREIPVHRGGFLGQIIRQAYPELIHNLDVRNDPVLGDALAEFRSMMAIPLFDNGEPLNWAIFLSRRPRGFTVTDLEEAILRSNLVGTAVRNVLIARELRDAHERIQAEVERIAMIQRSLLPHPLPQIPGLRIATSYETFDTAGGDMYDFAPLRFLDAQRTQPDPQGPWGLMIADASGHGPAAAVVTAMLNAILYAYSHDGRSPAALAEYANHHLVEKRIEGSFVTAFLAVYDPPSRGLRYARAGHNPPLLKNAGSGGAVRRLDDVGDVPLGVLDDVAFSDSQITLQPQQTLVLYTDGIVEAKGPGGDMFGVEGIERALTECTGEPECVVSSVTSALREHEAGIRPADDQTLVAIKLVD